MHKIRIKGRSATASKIDVSIVDDGVEESWHRIQIDDLLDRESRSPEFKLFVAKYKLLQFLKLKTTRRLTADQCAEFGERDLEL